MNSPLELDSKYLEKITSQDLKSKLETFWNGFCDKFGEKYIEFDKMVDDFDYDKKSILEISSFLTKLEKIHLSTFHLKEIAKEYINENSSIFDLSILLSFSDKFYHYKDDSKELFSDRFSIDYLFKSYYLTYNKRDVRLVKIEDFFTMSKLNKYSKSAKEINYVAGYDKLFFYSRWLITETNEKKLNEILEYYFYLNFIASIDSNMIDKNKMTFNFGLSVTETNQQRILIMDKLNFNNWDESLLATLFYNWTEINEKEFNIKMNSNNRNLQIDISKKNPPNKYLIKFKKIYQILKS